MMELSQVFPEKELHPRGRVQWTLHEKAQAGQYTTPTLNTLSVPKYRRGTNGAATGASLGGHRSSTTGRDSQELLKVEEQALLTV